MLEADAVKAVIEVCSDWRAGSGSRKVSGYAFYLDAVRNMSVTTAGRRPMVTHP